ncbi:MAG: ribonuclease Z [Bacteroidetes bacterium]|uniref:Ribonuclease Z n=1 Tax=Candidatus Gallipaludibacter merdavium TaxID=2840839 RepID=A0A9D9HUN9_9BACT|nr:ribonuclease Z [Candidatus Gallipaludibacter merdavium]
MNNTVTILGCGSALPTRINYPSSQLLELRDKQFLIDCGEGCQIRMRQYAVKTNRLNHIFISHLHGDHCFGLIGLLSSFGMLDRTADMHIHAHPDLEKILRAQLDYFCEGMSYKVFFEPINPSRHELVYEDRSVEVYSIPLKHRVPCCGYLFAEKERERHIIREMIDAYQVPVREIARIKQGADFVTEDGRVISNERLTTPASPAIRYVYCSDTAYSEKIIPWIEGVDCLYHEATFDSSLLPRAKETMHSTALQAAEIARMARVRQLIIGHFSARYTNQQLLLDEARSVFEATTLAKDGGVYKIGTL